MSRSFRVLAAVALTAALSCSFASPSDVSEARASDAIAPPSPLAETLRRVQTDNAAVRGLSDAALSPLVPRAERRDALVQLGDMYFYGNSSLDTRVNGTLAMSLYAEAAALGAPRAQFHVGVALSYGLWGSPLDEAAAMTHYYFAALGGDIGASMALGHKHLLGLGAPKKCESAVRYYEVAANEAVARREQNASHPAIYDLPHRRLKTVAESQHKKNLPGDSAIVDYYQFSADKGDPDATLNLATLYYYGARGLAQDVERSAMLFQKAYDLGASGGAYHLGHIYSLGIGVPQNNATAFKYLQEAVNEGNTAAQNELAHMYLLGKGTEQDEEQAVSLFKAAAKQGSMDAFYNLGVLHVRGGGSKGSILAAEHPEYEVAHGYFQVAAHQGHTVSSHKLGHMSLHGIGTTRSCKNAVESFKMVAERGEWDRILSQAYKDFKRQDYEASFMKYAVMAQQGYEVAQHNAAYLLDYDFLAPSAFSPMLSLTPSGMELENDIVASTAVMLYRLAAQQGNVDANLKIGDYYYYGKGGHPVDFVKASAHYSLASKRSNAQAMFNLALMYEHGIGVDQDFYLAKRFFDKARVSHSDASVPVTLALWKLRAHKSLRSWKRWWDELVGNVAPSKKVFSASEASTSGSSQSNVNEADTVLETGSSLLSLLEKWWPGDATFSTDMMLQDVFTNWREVLQSDNFLIFVLTIALGVVLYIRSERQYLQAPPPQQQPQ
ncbi:Protein sel-1-like protein 2 [Phytophthora ramorum]|uniref:Protein sel-1-like protein 2 n=1 Tax=Phytophthora ramorum TaxID=164328 RepID=UPI0030A3044C|nr:Protein sel-1-like protein 2 [Phytophthora ramorum]